MSILNAPICPVCSRDRVIAVFPGYFQCAGCGLAFSGILLSPERKGIFAGSPSERNIWEYSKRKIFDRGLTIIKKEIKKPGGRLLDIGCGYGYFLSLARTYFAETEGIELDSAAREAARNEYNLKVYEKQLRELNLAGDSYDAVTLWDVLYLLPQPMEDLKEIRRILKPGGIILARVMNFSFHKTLLMFGRKLRLDRLGLKPAMFQPWGFNKTSLVNLLGAAGFAEIRVMNSQMTSGDPYATGGKMGKNFVSLSKFLWFGCAQLSYRLTLKKYCLSSSLMVTARKESR